VKPVSLNNYGYLFGDVPAELFNKLKIECALAEQQRYGSDNHFNELHSGLSGNGVVKHYYVKDNLIELKQFILDTFYKFDYEFNYLKWLNLFNQQVSVAVDEPWINIQEKHEYIPNHRHDGIASFVIWIKIPYDIEKELASGTYSSTFEFIYNSVFGTLMNQRLSVSKEFEGKIMVFPSNLQHCVYPFITSDERRISISGNLSFDTRSIAG